jgi:hypothetical protein
MSYSIEHDGFSVESNTATSEAQMREALGVPGGVESPAEVPAEPAKVVAGPKPAAAAGDPDLQPVDGEADAASEAGKTLASRRKSIQARIDAATREKYDSKREADAAKTEAAALKAQLEVLKAGQSAQPAPEQAVAEPGQPASLAKPKSADFENYEDFVEALADYKAEQRVNAARAGIEREQASRGFAEAQSRTQAAGKAVHADFDTVVGDFVAKGHKFSEVATEVILNHPLGHKIAYALAKDIEANNLISNAPPAIAFLEMGRFIARLEAADSGPAPVVPAVTQAKAPIKPVGSSPVSTGDEPPTGDDLDAHIAYYNAKDKKAARR